MGIFNIFGRGKKDNINTVDHHPEIVVSEIDNGSHGDNIGGLLGFNSLNSDTGKEFINEYVAITMMKEAELRTSNYELRSISLLAPESKLDNLRLRVLSDNKNVLSVYPYLKTKYKIPFSSKEIIEWKHMNNCEAEIKGGGRNTFGFDFFATDYAINKIKYLQNKKFELNVSAIALVIDESKIDTNTEVKFSEDFVSYIPSSNLPRQTYYDFIGKVIDYTEVKLNNFNQGYIAKVKLINDDSDPNFFTIDMFINKENMKISTLKKDMKITGLLWFQGEIANK